MVSKNRMTVVAVSLSAVLVGCGSDSVSIADTSSGASVADTSANASGVSSSNPIELTVDGRGDFFNADAGIDFASYIGSSLSTVSNRAVGSSSRVFGEVSQNDDPASGLYNDDTFVNECDSGSVSNSVGTGSNDQLEKASIVFNNCVIDGQTTSGSMSFSSSSSGNSENLSISFDDFASSGPEGNSALDGDVVISIDEDFSATIGGSNLTISDDIDTTVFSNYSLAMQADLETGATSIGGQATITSTANGEISFQINPVFFADSNSDNPTSGVMTMVHSDGSSLVIDAGTGNPDTYAYTISGGGSVTSGIGSWDDEDFEVPALN